VRISDIAATAADTAAIAAVLLNDSGYEVGYYTLANPGNPNCYATPPSLSF